MPSPDFSYFEQFANFEKTNTSVRNFHLARMVSLLEDFQNPHEGISFVHVAGSKGKGSTAAFIAALLADSLGSPVGIYSSPHVHDYRERIRTALPGMDNYREGFFPDEIYEAGIERIKAYLAHNHTPPTTFELLTLLSFLLFHARKLSWAVVEVGLGGRLDSTNVIQPRLSVITPLEIEHSRYLGNTIAEIAREKAGIIKPGIPVLSQKQEKNAGRVIQERAQECKAPCHFHDTDAELKKFAAAVRHNTAYIRDNACLAYAAFRLLMQSGGLPVRCKLTPLQAAESINRTHLPGRFEKRSISSPQNPKLRKQVFLDAAHTPASVAAFLSGLEPVRKQHPEKTLSIIFSALEDKNHSAMLKKIIPACDRLILTNSGNFKRCDLGKLSRLATQFAGTEARLFVVEDPVEAFHNTINNDKTDDIIAVCGSFYLLGEIYRSLDERGTA